MRSFLASENPEEALVIGFPPPQVGKPENNKVYVHTYVSMYL